MMSFVVNWDTLLQPLILINLFHQEAQFEIFSGSIDCNGEGKDLSQCSIITSIHKWEFLDWYTSI